MTLDQLRMLVALEEAGSVLGAAEQLHRTQPTISVGLRKLEEQLGVTILDRRQYRARLTADGELLCHKARQILRNVKEFGEIAEQLQTGKEAELTLAIEASCPMDLVVRLLREARERFPHTQFNLTAETLWGAIEKVSLNEADLALSPWFHEDDQLESLSLTTTTLTTVAAPEFIPLQENRQLQLDDLRDSVQIVIRDSSRRPPTDKYGLVEGGRRWVVNDHETKKNLILAGMGWGRLQNHLISSELANGRLVQLDIDGYPCSLQLDLRLIRQRGKIHGPVATGLWQDCQNLLSASASI